MMPQITGGMTATVLASASRTIGMICVLCFSCLGLGFVVPGGVTPASVPPVSAAVALAAPGTAYVAVVAADGPAEPRPIAVTAPNGGGSLLVSDFLIGLFSFPSDPALPSCWDHTFAACCSSAGITRTRVRVATASVDCRSTSVSAGGSCVSVASTDGVSVTGCLPVISSTAGCRASGTGRSWAGWVAGAGSGATGGCGSAGAGAGSAGGAASVEVAGGAGSGAGGRGSVAPGAGAGGAGAPGAGERGAGAGAGAGGGAGG